MSRSQRRWQRKTLKLKKDHGWTSEPGCKIFVADRGAVRFDFPQDWVVVPGDTGSIKFHDRKPPDDDCTLEMTVMYLPEDVDWSGLPLSTLVRDIIDRDRRNPITKGEIVDVKRGRLEISWAEVRFIDPKESREAHSRTCLARWSNIQPLITFDYWAADAPRVCPVWDRVLRTLTLGDYVEDPTRRVVD